MDFKAPEVQPMGFKVIEVKQSSFREVHLVDFKAIEVKQSVLGRSTSWISKL